MVYCMSMAAQKDTIRLLTIGNSFSDDAVERYLYELADEAGVKMIIGNAYRGGQSLESHWKQGSTGQLTIEYRKVVNGVRSNTPGYNVRSIIADEPWDYISFQQASHYSGQKRTYEPWLTRLMDFTRAHMTNKEAKFGFHMTWAYSKSSNHGGFANYGSRQDVMYDSIIHAVKHIMETHQDLSFLVPSGTAIQNARSTYLGDNMNRDGYHLDLRFGRYIAACTWLEVLTGISPVGLRFRPEGVDSVTAVTCQTAAHMAAQNPWAVTEMKNQGFAEVNDIVPNGQIKLNFGVEQKEDSEWNDITPNSRTHTWIEDTEGNATGIVITCTRAFGGTNTNGATDTQTKMLMPKAVSESCVWGYTAGKFNGSSAAPMGEYTLSHLNPKLKYDFVIYGSRMDCQDLRETTYILHGKNVHAGELDAANNAKETLVIKNVRPTEDGIIRLLVMPGNDNTNVYRFYYLNAVSIKAHK